MRGAVDLRGRMIRGVLTVGFLVLAWLAGSGILVGGGVLSVVLAVFFGLMGLLGIVEVAVGICFLKALGIRVPF